MENAAVRLSQKIKLALDDLRTQMLGAQVLFGFQLQSAFQSDFSSLSRSARTADLAALALMVLSVGLLLAAPARLRLTDRGEGNTDIGRAATFYSGLALFPFSIAMGLDIYVAMGRMLAQMAIWAGTFATLIALSAWYAPILVRRSGGEEEKVNQKTSIHDKIQDMLTETRIVLPGVQALLGFQFVVTLTRTFAGLDPSLRLLHLSGLAMNALSVILLIAPAAIHRITFRGEDTQRFYVIGSTIVTVALVPLAFATSAEFYVAAMCMVSNATTAAAGAVAVLALLLGLWYALPLWLRARRLQTG